jgi:hypothetical protein
MRESLSRAPRLLCESTGLVRDFLLRQQNVDGGFKDRAGQSDLYYCVFGIEALLALSEREPAACGNLERYLASFGAGENLDLAHYACLIRCWANLEKSIPAELRNPERLEIFRAKDGGYNAVPGSQTSAPYGCFLVLGAYQDLQAKPPNAIEIVGCLAAQQNENGSWENATNATAAALASLAMLTPRFSLEGLRIWKKAKHAAEWLLARAHPQGGFLAMPNTPMPDLLSTATTIHTLAALEISLDPVREKCLDFIDSLWSNEGGFHGHWLDETLDCEYTYYGLLALGNLA